MDQVFSRVQAKLSRRRRQRIALTAGVLGVLSLGTFWWQRPFATMEQQTLAFVAIPTRSDAPREEVLADGTVVELRRGARLVVDFTETVRRVTLQEGQAHFQVAKNPQRPFVVTAGGVDIRAVGTAFAVQLGTQAVDVIVTEGHVAVEKTFGAGERLATPPQPYASVTAGHQVTVELAHPPAPVPVVELSPAEVAERLAWRVPRLELAATSLDQALVLFNRHTSVHLRLADPELGKLELSGVIRADNADSLLRLLSAEFGIEADRRGDEIVLSRGR
ncbi:MAG: FecR domain-containing protein [Opitutaceae bacterium]|nr:FecR domain-containing protein [Opitutaceae bacterium]